MRSATNTMNRVYKDVRYDNLSALFTFKVPSGILGPVKPKGYMFYDVVVGSMYISDGTQWILIGGSQPNASYIVMTDSGLPDQRILVSSPDVTVTDGGAGGNATLDLSDSGVTLGNYYEPFLSLSRGRITFAEASRRGGFSTTKLGGAPQQITQSMTPVILTVWDNEVPSFGGYNTDNCFDFMAGIFTAQVSGYYRVDIFVALNASLIAPPVDVTPEMRLQLSTGEYISSFGNAYQATATMQILTKISCVLHIEEGTQANCAVIVDLSIASYTISVNPYAFFSMQLIFRD